MNDNNSCALVLSESSSRDAANQFHSSLPMRNGMQDESIIAASTERRIRLMAFTRNFFFFLFFPSFECAPSSRRLSKAINKENVSFPSRSVFILPGCSPSTRPSSADIFFLSVARKCQRAATQLNVAEQWDAHPIRADECQWVQKMTNVEL